MSAAVIPIIGIPRFSLSIANVAVAPAVQADIGSIELCEDINMPAMLSFSMNLWDGMHMRLKEDYLDQFALGTSLELKLGIDDDIQIFTGEVTALEPEFGGVNSPDSLRVRAYNRLHRLQFGNPQRPPYIEKSSSEIASEVAEALGLTPKVDATTVKHPYVLQANETDMAFLLRLAAPLHYEVSVEDKDLYFRRPQVDEGAAVSLTYRRDLIQFSPRQRVITTGASVTVRGWNALTKEPIVGVAGAGDEASKMGGSRTGAELSAAAFMSSTRSVPGEILMDADEAAEIARAWYDRDQSDFIEAQGESAGSPLIRAGKTIEIVGVGKMYSTKYQVISAKHTIGPTGYRTQFEVRRNSV